MEELKLQEAFAQKGYFRAVFAEEPRAQQPPACLRIIESHGDQVAFLASCCRGIHTLLGSRKDALR